MILLDVNVLVHAHREDADRMLRSSFGLKVTCKRHLECGFGVGAQRLFTRDYPSKDFQNTNPSGASARIRRGLPHAQGGCVLGPGPDRWHIFTQLCRKADARGNLVPDAYHAALALELGCEWITLDRGFARFPGLKWKHPLE
jgi:predicted nucleic acid-binding protein